MWMKHTHTPIKGMPVGTNIFAQSYKIGILMSDPKTVGFSQRWTQWQKQDPEHFILLCSCFKKCSREAYLATLYPGGQATTNKENGKKVT